MERRYAELIDAALKSKDKKRSFLLYRLLRKNHMRREEVRKLFDPIPVNLDPNPDGLQYRPTPDDLMVMERRKRFRKKMESGWFGGMGNN